MPPRVNVTGEQVLDAALVLVREKGYASLNAREIAKTLGCSTQPIFSRFASMDLLRAALHRHLGEYFNSYVHKRMVGENPFRQVGLAYIGFAKEEPNLFRVLFMSDLQRLDGFGGFFGEVENVEVARNLASGLGVSLEAAKRIFMKSWIFSHGIASMIATNSIQLTDDEIQQMLGESYRAFLLQEKQVEGEIV